MERRVSLKESGKNEGKDGLTHVVHVIFCRLIRSWRGKGQVRDIGEDLLEMLDAGYNGLDVGFFNEIRQGGYRHRQAWGDGQAAS